MNIWPMVVTLDVSKLSGWLSADARCRVEGHAMREEVWAGRREGVGWRRRKRHVHGDSPTQGWGGQGTGHARSAHGTCCTCP